MKPLMFAFVLLLTGVLGMAPATASPPPGVPASPRIPAPPGLVSADVSFRGHGGLTLHGTVLAPAKASGPLPGMVLVTGSGSGVPREYLLTEATEFARRGIAVLIYDKRSAGYTDFRRSYSELADDALGGLRLLRGRPGVDPAKVGIWGLSEGGWVVPLAASRSGDVAFVILVGANAMTPLRQQTWQETAALRRAGVRGSLVERGRTGFLRMGADAGLFAEAHHDAQGVLRRVRQPLLGIWGTHDLETQPADNPPLFARALRAGGNTAYTFRFFPGADHSVHESPDGGVTRGEALAPGYADLVGSWVRDVTNGRLPDADAPAPPEQAHPSAEVPPSAWWESATTQVAVFALVLAGFAAYPLTGLVRRLRRRKVRTVSRWARLLSGAGLIAVLGLPGYLFSMAGGTSPDLGPLIAHRTLPWLSLQALAVAAVAAGITTLVAWRRAPVSVPRGEAVRLGALLTTGAVFLAWSCYWGLLLP